MKESCLDLHTAEQMLRGEPTGPPELAELLATATSEPAAEELEGEEAALAAFLQARALADRQPRPRRLSPSVSLRATLIGFLLLLAGGVTAAAASQRLPGPLGGTHTHPTSTPKTSEMIQTRPPASASSGPDPSPKHQQQTPTRPGTHSTDSSRSSDPRISPGPLPTTAVPELPDPVKKLRGKALKTSKAKLTKSATSSVPLTGVNPATGGRGNS